jgi:hypothetical protein
MEPAIGLAARGGCSRISLLIFIGSRCERIASGRRGAGSDPAPKRCAAAVHSSATMMMRAASGATLCSSFGLTACLEGMFVFLVKTKIPGGTMEVVRAE